MPETQNPANQGQTQNANSEKAATVPEIIYDGNCDVLREKIHAQDSFVLSGLSDGIDQATREVERLIEGIGLSCRVYSRNRSAVATATVLIPAVALLMFSVFAVFDMTVGPMVILAGAAAHNMILGLLMLAAIAGHNLATSNPDFEVGKDPVHKKLYVTYKKGGAK